jgi:hypothetical protein
VAGGAPASGAAGGAPASGTPAAGGADADEGASSEEEEVEVEVDSDDEDEDEDADVGSGEASSSSWGEEEATAEEQEQDVEEEQEEQEELADSDDSESDSASVEWGVPDSSGSSEGCSDAADLPHPPARQRATSEPGRRGQEAPVVEQSAWRSVMGAWRALPRGMFAVKPLRVRARSAVDERLQQSAAGSAGRPHRSRSVDESKWRW